MRLSNGTHKTCQRDPTLADLVERCVVENNTALLYRNGSLIGLESHLLIILPFTNHLLAYLLHVIASL